MFGTGCPRPYHDYRGVSVPVEAAGENVAHQSLQVDITGSDAAIVGVVAKVGGDEAEVGQRTGPEIIDKGA